MREIEFSSLKGVIGLSLSHLSIFWKGGAEHVYVDCFSDFLSLSEVLSHNRICYSLLVN